MGDPERDMVGFDEAGEPEERPEVRRAAVVGDPEGCAVGVELIREEDAESMPPLVSFNTLSNGWVPASFEWWRSMLKQPLVVLLSTVPARGWVRGGWAWCVGANGGANGWKGRGE